MYMYNNAGQYNGKSKPMPEYHAKIASFDSKILVLNSIRKPKRLTIIGDNTKEFRFLVKGGEDLRHDQRIEQVREDYRCSQKLSNCVFVCLYCSCLMWWMLFCVKTQPALSDSWRLEPIKSYQWPQSTCVIDLLTEGLSTHMMHVLSWIYNVTLASEFKCKCSVKRSHRPCNV